MKHCTESALIILSETFSKKSITVYDSLIILAFFFLISSIEVKTVSLIFIESIF